MKTLFHGTTYDNYLSILENGFDSSLTGVMTWNCSDDSAMYFYDLDKDVDCCEEEDEIKESCIRRAFENAQITAGIQGFNGNKLVVMELHVDDDLCEDDHSCDNMAESATVVESSDISIEDIKNVYISDDAYNPHLRFFYIASLGGNNQLNTGDFDDVELQAFNIIASQEMYIEDLIYFEWEAKYDK